MRSTVLSGTIRSISSSVGNGFSGFMFFASQTSANEWPASFNRRSSGSSSSMASNSACSSGLRRRRALESELFIEVSPGLLLVLLFVLVLLFHLLLLQLLLLPLLLSLFA